MTKVAASIMSSMTGKTYSLVLSISLFVQVNDYRALVCQPLVVLGFNRAQFIGPKK